MLRMLTAMVTFLLIAGKVSAAHADGDGDPGPGGGEAHPHQAELGQSQLGDSPQEKLAQGENHLCLSRICIFFKLSGGRNNWHPRN
jgi:hypothetical protein